jgi:hypothetical protein
MVGVSCRGWTHSFNPMQYATQLQHMTANPGAYVIDPPGTRLDLPFFQTFLLTPKRKPPALPGD